MSPCFIISLNFSFTMLSIFGANLRGLENGSFPVVGISCTYECFTFGSVLSLLTRFGYFLMSFSTRESSHILMWQISFCVLYVLCLVCSVSCMFCIVYVLCLVCSV